MKKLLVVGTVLLLIGITIIPLVNADFCRSSKKSEFVEVATEIFESEKIRKHTVELSNEDAGTLESLFESARERLDDAQTKMETVKVFYDVIISLNESGLLPDEISVK